MEKIKDVMKNQKQTMVAMTKIDHCEQQTLKKIGQMYFSGHTFNNVSLLSHLWTVSKEIKMGLWSL